MCRSISGSVSWALCPWFEESGDHLVHPDDLERLRAFRPYGVVFQVLSEEGDYIKIACGDDVFRINGQFLRIIEPEEGWLFDIGETVSVQGRDYTGTIVGISWHYKEEKPMYGLMVDGKRKNKRYWPKDLRKFR